MPNVKTLVMRSVPEATTRALMVRTGEADISIALDGPDAEGLQKDQASRSSPSKHASIFWIEFPKQWDPKSPWHDKRVRHAVNYALNRDGDQPGRLSRLLPAGRGHRAARHGITRCRPSRPPTIRRRPSSCSPRRAIRTGFDAGEFAAIPGFPTVAEAVVNDLNAVGIRVRLRQMERATFYAELAGRRSCRRSTWSPPATPATRPAGSKTFI